MRSAKPKMSSRWSLAEKLGQHLLLRGHPPRFSSRLLSAKLQLGVNATSPGKPSWLQQTPGPSPYFLVILAPPPPRWCFSIPSLATLNTGGIRGLKCILLRRLYVSFVRGGTCLLHSLFYQESSTRHRNLGRMNDWGFECRLREKEQFPIQEKDF